MIPAFSQVVPTTSGWDSNNNNTGDSSPPIKEETDDVPNNWMPLFLPQYKSRLSKFHRTFEEIPPNEKLVDDYVCALRRDILLQGRLYISVNYIAFYSNILGYETCLTIKFSDVTKIVKATTMKVFPNAIEIFTNTGEKHILTSFVSRERAFALMMKLWSYSGDKDKTEKMKWQEICKIIRNSYMTNTLPHDLSELDELDLEQHILKGKSVTKKLQTKKEKLKMLESEQTHHRTDSTASFLSAFEDLSDNEETANQFSSDRQAKTNEIDLNLLKENSKNSGLWSDNIRIIMPGMIGNGIADVIEYCNKKKNILRVCVIVSLVLLLVQMSLLCWVTLFENKMNNYEKLLLDSMAIRRSKLQQQHLILNDSV